MKFIRQWLNPISASSALAFHEKNLRIITLLVVPMLVISILANIVAQNTVQAWLASSTWAMAALVIMLIIGVALARGAGVLAYRLSIFISFLTLFDTSVAYWSTGTIIMTIFLSFMYLWIIPQWRELVVAWMITWGVYLYIIFNSSEAPLPETDVFYSPITAFISTILSSIFFAGIGYYMRTAQYQHHRQLLQFQEQQTQLQEQHARTLRNFLNHVTHDLKTPITNLKLRLYLMEHDHDKNSDKHYQVLNRNVDHLEDILNHILAITHIDSGVDFRPVYTNMKPLIDNATVKFAEFAATKNQKIMVQADDSIDCLIDPQFLQKAIDNILENAIYNTPANGQIWINLHKKGNDTVIEIKDNGVGIAPDVLPHIFDRFYRGDDARNTTTGKIGLGLTISEKIFEMHGGSITVESELGQGSTFRLILPDIARQSTSPTDGSKSDPV